MVQLGEHRSTEVLGMKDVNGLTMVMCRDCETTAHAATAEVAQADLSRARCTAYCRNCKALRHSYDGAPAVPEGGRCNDLTHVCPRDGSRWWQANTHFHLWQQVTSDREWEIVRGWQLNPPRDDY